MEIVRREEKMQNIENLGNKKKKEKYINSKFHNFRNASFWLKIKVLDLLPASFPKHAF